MITKDSEYVNNIALLYSELEKMTNNLNNQYQLKTTKE